MYFDGHIRRNWAGALTPAWRRNRRLPSRGQFLTQNHPYLSGNSLSTSQGIRKLNKRNKCDGKRHMFNFYPQNENLDIYTKRAAFKASKFVVSLEASSGDVVISENSGFIIESVDTYSIILTAASLLKPSSITKSVADDIKVIVHLPDGRAFHGQIEAYDVYYNVAAIKIQSDTLLPTATLIHLTDSIVIDPSHHPPVAVKSFQLRPHSTSFNLIPGEVVIALGRYPKNLYPIMAAPGLLRTDRSDYDCQELFVASFNITSCGKGGPLINRYGEVIGICLRGDSYTSEFLPINIASLWWEHYKKYRQTRRPWLGMEVTNLYAAPLETLERIIPKFPDGLKGVIVDEVVPGSSAEAAGIKYGDVIIQFGEKKIRGFLELFENMWDKVGESAELVVIREGEDDPLHLSMAVHEITSD